MDDWLPQLQILGEVALAGFLGGVIGWEREQAHKPAGLRTHMLVAAAAALLMGLGQVLINHFAQPETHALVEADPIRIMQAIIIGVSFLGTGTIITNSRSDDIQGLTTAASVLLTTAIGITVALEQFLLAVGVTALALAVLIGVRKLEVKFGVGEADDNE